ncbi:uncharacterized protein LOC100178123 [Ciona intestinalis]
MDKRKKASNSTQKAKKSKITEESSIDAQFAYLKDDVDPVPEVYTKKPVQPTEVKPGQLTPKQVDEYFDKGFLLVKDFFKPERLNKVRKAVDQLVDELVNKLYDAGKIKDKHADKDFFTRLSYIEKQFKGTSVILHKRGILHDEFKALWSDDKLLNVVEQLIGPDIAGHPVWNLRTKTPHNEQATVPWHQDNAYLEPRSLEVHQLTAWIPLVDANMVNGCMQLATGGHRAGKTLKHTCCAGGTWYVEMQEKDLDQLGVDASKDIVTCEVPYGGVLFLNNAIPHQSLENLSDIIRWSLDLRWQRPDKPNGFYGIKDCVVMRKKDDPKYVVDWSELSGCCRSQLQMKKVDEDDTDLHPEIAGPWMKRWDIVHHNRHTELLNHHKDTYTSWHKA